MLADSEPLVNVAGHLARMAARQPDRPAVVCPPPYNRPRRPTQQFTFAQLHRESDRRALALERLGITSGMRVVLMVRPGLEFFALTFALFKMGAVTVLVDPGLGFRSLGRCLTEARPQAFVGIPLAHLARVVGGWAKASLHLNILVGPRWGWGGITLAQALAKVPDQAAYAAAKVTAEATAAILFTSGSTGSPKGAVYSHGNFAAQVEMIRATYGIEPGEIDLPTFPLFALFAPALGMTAIIPNMDFTRPARVDPREILHQANTHRATMMFGSPALLDAVGHHAQTHGGQLPTIRRVLTAGAPVRPDILATFRCLLEPTAEIFTPFGATEALPVASIGSQEILAETQAATARGRGNCVGRPVAGAEVRIIAITDDPLPTWRPELEVARGTIGEICVRGPQVTRSYFGRDDATRLAKIVDPASGSVWHRMGDLGYFDDQGRLWFCGRKSHRVITPDGTLFTICCEGVFNAHPQVRRTALVGVGMPPRQTPVLWVELRDRRQRALWPRIEAELRAMGQSQDHTRGIERFLWHPSFPVDIRHNAKIHRERLAQWAERRLA
jgi:acyl-CoA synthetase (AMP-forming)/AMP-acid ligase II